MGAGVATGATPLTLNLAAVPLKHFFSPRAGGALPSLKLQAAGKDVQGGSPTAASPFGSATIQQQELPVFGRVFCCIF